LTGCNEQDVDDNVNTDDSFVIDDMNVDVEDE
jgi:hypothetical protein